MTHEEDVLTRLMLDVALILIDENMADAEKVQKAKDKHLAALRELVGK